MYLFVTEHRPKLNVDKSRGSTTRFAKNTYSFLLKTQHDQLNVKNLEKSTKLSEFF